ncbi:MAG: cellulase family glycosylhydrolase [Polyangiaceae bacterium]|nr:cellulase family glycosylhydrolase [Polyangiaceae bacterium]
MSRAANRRSWRGLLTLVLLVGATACSSNDGVATNGGAGGGATGGSGGGATGGSGGGATGGSGGSGGVPLPCDDGFVVTGAPVHEGVQFEISYTNAIGYTYIDMNVSGPGYPVTSALPITGDGPYTWAYTVSGHGTGVLSFDFVEGKTGGKAGNVLASCQVESLPGSGGASGSSGGSGSGFVTQSGTHFQRDGAEYQFVGVNLRGLPHYGHEALPYADASQIELNLSSVQGMGGRVVRSFVAYHGIDAQETGNRLEKVLNAADQHGLTVIVVLTDFYQTGFNPQGDDGYYATDSNGYVVLDHDFFANGYKNNYEPQVQALVTRFKDHPAIFSWELGNEIRDATFQGQSSGATFVSFCTNMASAIRAIDTNHMISVGEIGATITGLSSNEQQTLFSNPDISFLTTRSYNGGNSDDTGIAKSVNKPIIVEEAGFDGGGRPAKVAQDLAKWFGKGCRGYLQWGFMASAGDNGDGDTQWGMDHQWHKDDWDGLYKTYQTFAQGL